MSTILKESSNRLSKSGKLWRAVLITPGQGSSGKYAEAMLKEHGPKAFPAGSHSYVDHPDEQNPTRSPKNLMAVLATDAFYEENVGLVADLEIMPHWADFVEAVAPYTGLSIFAAGEKDDDDNVTELIESRQNSVDLVSYAGRGGSLAEKLYESAVADFAKDSAPVVEQSKENERKSQMEIEELAEKVELLAESLAALATSLVPVIESLKPVEIPEVDPTAAVKVAYEKAIEAALPEKLRKVVVAAVEADAEADIDALIKDQTDLIASLKESFVESVGFVREAAPVTDVSSVIPGSWK
jgi:hypothetical protein